jgi:hypothetical protein
MTLTRLIDNEVISAMGLPLEGWPGLFFHRVLSRATGRFSQMFVEVDRIIGERGLAAGARWLLLNLVDDFTARGVQNIPAVGPLVIASNHPGTVDSIALTTAVGRDDLKILASAIGFLQNLPNVSEHLIFVPRDDTQRRMLAVRESIQHLQQGGALLLFARAGIDPDPAFMCNAEQELARWSRSLEIFLRAVPQTRMIASIVSHVIEPKYMHHPITWLRRSRPDRQRLAMMIQVIQEMLGRKLDLVPRVSFGQLLDSRAIGSPHQALQCIIDSAASLMRSHLAWQV